MIGEHEEHGEEQHRKKPQEAVHEDGRDRFGFAFFGFARSVPGFEDVAAGGAEQEAVEELADHGDLKSFAEPDADFLGLQEEMPAPGTERHRGADAKQGEKEAAPVGE